MMFSVFKKCHWKNQFTNTKLRKSLFCSCSDKDLPDLNFDYLCDSSNFEEIRNNIRLRKGVGDIDKVIELHNAWISASNKEKKHLIKQQLVQAALKIPNKSHPDIASLEEKPLVIDSIGDKMKPHSKALQFHDISHKLNICRTENISNFTGPRSYFFMDYLCSLEQALIRYSLSFLKKLNFELISVPDILPREIIEYCGMDTRGERHQVYALAEGIPGNLCLSGTAEIGIAYYLSKRKIMPCELPLRIMAVSRCFRAETSKVSEEKGVYRVHQFTKVEMFGATQPSQSDSLLNEFVGIQQELFKSLGLTLRTLDMPPPELGAQAARKYDVEAWLPGRRMWGEISSASSCTDYQSRRLGIRTQDGYVHTVNGTASAVPRLALALLETHAQGDSSKFIGSLCTACYNYSQHELHIQYSRLADIKLYQLPSCAQKNGERVEPSSGSTVSSTSGQQSADWSWQPRIMGGERQVSSSPPPPPPPPVQGLRHQERRCPRDSAYMDDI